MKFTLKHYDTPLLEFSATMDTSEPELDILWVDEEKRSLLPLDMQTAVPDLSRWLQRRTIPRNRAFVHDLLARCGLSLNRPMHIISACKGLSLNDCYWVVPEGFDGAFADNNLYENPFSTVLAALAFTGYGDSGGSRLYSSPEFTTNGMLPKCWRRTGGKVVLYKGGTEGASNAGFEPYSEYYASRVAEAMGLSAVSYGLSRWKGRLCSTCELFTSIETAFLPVGYLVRKGGMQAVRAYYEALGPQFAAALDDMLVFDAVVCNTDRHFGNFGFLIDSRTNQITAPAPLFDHGNALFNFAGASAWESAGALEAYVKTLQPSVYDDFLGTAAAVLTPRHRQMLRKLVDFRIPRHSRYNLPKKRLDLMEKQVQARARLLLESGGAEGSSVYVNM